MNFNATARCSFGLPVEQRKPLIAEFVRLLEGVGELHQDTLKAGGRVAAAFGEDAQRLVSVPMLVLTLDLWGKEDLKTPKSNPEIERQGGLTMAALGAGLRRDGNLKDACIFLNLAYVYLARCKVASDADIVRVVQLAALCWWERGSRKQATRALATASGRLGAASAIDPEIREKQGQLLELIRQRR